MFESLNITGIEKAAVLAALYNAAGPSKAEPDGYDATHVMTLGEARELLSGTKTYFNIIMGRNIAVSLNDNQLNYRIYDERNGRGMTEKVLEPLLAAKK